MGTKFVYYSLDLISEWKRLAETQDLRARMRFLQYAYTLPTFGGTLFEGLIKNLNFSFFLVN